MTKDMESGDEYDDDDVIDEGMDACSWRSRVS
jgi:hypothetical protein